MNSTPQLGIAVIGCGNAGHKRLDAIEQFPELARLVCISDTDEARLRLCCNSHVVRARTRDYHEAVDRPDVDAVFVSLPNTLHFEVSQYALKQGKHVLCEKPLAIDENQAEALVQLAQHSGAYLKTGSNHRFLPNIKRAIAIVEQGLIGKVVFIRGHRGHANVLPPWFYDRSLSGGGAILDLGVHLFDLAQCLLRDIVRCTGVVQVRDPGDEVESEGFGIFQSAYGQVAMLHASWTEWDKHLSLEIYGRDGFVNTFVSRDGKLELVWGNKDGARQHESQWEEIYDSWTLDTFEFLEAVTQGRQPLASGYDGLVAVRMASALYRSSREGASITLKV